MTVATRWPLVGRRDELVAFTAALNDPGCEAFCIYGPPGVGKTRLGDECVALAAAAGRRVLSAAADPGRGDVPLGAVAHLLPARALAAWGAGDPTSTLMQARIIDAARRALILQPGETGRPVLLLDDAHRFDSTSLAVIDRLLATGDLFCVATVVTGDAVPETVTRWWRNDRATRIDLTDLDDIGVDTLLHVALEGPLDSAASAELWRASRGNLLALRELVLGAMSRNVLARRDGVWRLDGPLGSPTRLRELVEARLAHLSADARDTLELLALCQPLGLIALERSVGLGVLEQLERDGLVVVRADGRRENVSLAHPLHRDVLRSALKPLRSRSVLLGQAELIEQYGARRREDPIRIATWRLEATGRADPDLLVLGARLARFGLDFRRAATLARAAMDSGPTATAGLLLGESLYNLGDFTDAENVLERAMSLATDEDELVKIATVRRRNLCRGCRRDADALAVGHEAVSRVTSEAARHELLTGEAEVLALSGRAREALAVAAEIDESERRLRVLADIPRALALAAIGRTREAVSVSAAAYDEHMEMSDALAIASPGTHRVNELYALIQAGDLATADRKGQAWFKVASQARMPLGVIWVAVHLARCAVLQGKPETALRWTDRAARDLESSAYEGLRPTLWSVRAVASGMLGDAPASVAAADQADELTSGFGFLASEVFLGRAWAQASSGQISVARATLLAAGNEAQDAGFVPSAAWLFHDAARLGAADEASPRLASLATLSDSALVAARADHAAALAAGDAELLAAAMERFEQIGAMLLAAEAAVAAADALRRVGAQRRATSLEVRSEELASACEGARTPALLVTRAVVPLTDREREVAVLAATGHPSRAIADRLFLSVRTVENHLARAYTKLGVSSRTELSAALDPDSRENSR